MIPLALLCAFLLATFASECCALWLGPAAASWPSLATALSLAAARWAQRPWHRGAAIGLGFVDGLGSAGAIIPSAIALLVVSGLVRQTRRLWSRNSLRITFFLGAIGAFVAEWIRQLFGVGPLHEASGSARGFLFVAIGALSTGAALVMVERVIASSPRLLRHMERS